MPRRAVDVPVVARRHDFMSQRVHMTVLAPQSQYTDRVVDTPFVQQRTSSSRCELLRRRWRSHRTSASPRSKFSRAETRSHDPESSHGSVVAAGAVHRRSGGYPSCATKKRFVTLQVAQKTMEIPQDQCVAKTAGVSVVMQRQAPLMMQLLVRTNEDDLDTCAHTMTRMWMPMLSCESGSQTERLNSCAGSLGWQLAGDSSAARVKNCDGVRSRHDVGLGGVRESSSVLRGNVVSDTEAIGASLRLAAQEELWTQGVQVSVNRREMLSRRCESLRRVDQASSKASHTPRVETSLPFSCGLA